MAAKVKDEGAHTTLEALEMDVLTDLDAVVGELDRLLGFPTRRAPEQAQPTLDIDDQLRDSRHELHGRILALRTDDDTGTVGDLRLVAALLHVTTCIGRMAEQCAILAQLMPSQGHQPFADAETAASIQLMGDLARSQAVGAKRAFRLRDIALVERLLRRDSEIKRTSREVFERAMAVARRERVRTPITITVIVSRCLETIADDAFDIAEEAAFVSSGSSDEARHATAG